MVVESKALAIPHKRDPVPYNSADYDVLVTQENMTTKPVSGTWV